MDTLDYEKIFLDEMAKIDRIIAFVARRYRLRKEDAEDLASTVKLKLVSDDYALLRRFEGRSKLETYLFTVINSLFWEWRNRLWGRWRPSAEAKRQGTTAIRLEEMVCRDGLSFSEAVHTLRINYRVKRTEAELEELMARLPRRSQRSFVGQEHLEGAAMQHPSPEEKAMASQRQESGRRLWEELRKALGSLPAEEQLILKLRFQQGVTVAGIARSLGHPQKQLYRRLEKIIKKLYNRLRIKGIRHVDQQEWLAALKAVCNPQGENQSPSPPSLFEGIEE